MESTSPTSRPSLLEPATILEPNDREKRVSQIVYNSGFINKLSDVPTNLNNPASLSKGWKPFKMELKGSKLYFYKPPGDRNASIRDLFPVELILEDTVDEVAQPEKEDPFAAAADFGMGSRSATVREEAQPGAARRKRAFWGRGTHPSLQCNEGGVVKQGNLEALVHETVFGTTFDLEGTAEEWKVFASAILLTLPHYIGLPKFEAELLRYLNHLVSGAGEEEKPSVLARVQWIACECDRLHGKGLSHEDWDTWMQQAGIKRPAPVNSSGPPSSASMQALHTPSPHVGMDSSSNPLAGDQLSLNINTFSPRPASDGITTFMDVLSDHTLQLSPFSLPAAETKETQVSKSRPIPRRIKTNYSPPWNLIESSGLSRELLSTMDPFFVADSLTLYHRYQLEQSPVNLEASDLLGSSLHPQDDPLLSFLGSDEHPHWLTKMLLIEILVGDMSTKGNSQDVGKPAAQTSRTHARSEIISIWARVGELCRLEGDECTWQAIKAALCARPIARLDKVWKRVDPNAYNAVYSWAHGSTTVASEPLVTPWAAAIRDDMEKKLNQAKSTQGEDIWSVAPLAQIWRDFEALRMKWSLCPKKLPEGDEPGEQILRMVNFWREKARQGGDSGGLAEKFISVDNFMSLSLAAENRRQGMFEPFFWQRSGSASGLHANSALIPLFFVDPLPSVSFLDRAVLLRGRCDSDGPEGQLLPTINQPLYGLDSSQVSFHRRSYLGDNSPLTGGTVIPAYNSDLLLVVQPNPEPPKLDSRPSSRPPSSAGSHTGPDKPIMSRQTSIRVKPGSSQVLDRKTSVSRRNSLPLLSQRSNILVSETTVGPSLRVQVQAGTLNALVNILVFGLQNMCVSVSDDNGETSLREGKTRELMLDRVEYENLWWLVFRSFITPLVFFELLKKLYVTCKNDGYSLPILEASNVTIIRCHVLDTMKSWLTVGGGAQDTLDDPQLYSAVQTFINSSVDHVIPKSDDTDQGTNACHDTAALDEARQSLSSVFKSQTMRSSHRIMTLPNSTSLNGSRMRSMSTRDIPDIDRVNVEEFLDNLDGMIFAAFNNIGLEDFFTTIDLLEVQTVDRTAWFSPKEGLLADDVVEIQTMYTHILEVPPSSLVSESGQESIYRLLPPGIRSSIRAYSILRKWLISKLVARNIGLRTRQNRMELLLQAIEVARLRCSSDHNHACIRSGVEAVILSAILSVESRTHQKAWQNIAIARGVSCESVASYLSISTVNSTRSKDPFTVDLGWILERVLEIISAPDVLESSSTDGQNLVNLDKRKHLSTLISNATSVFSAPGQGQQKEHVIRRGFERLHNIEKEVSSMRFEPRAIKEEAAREAQSASIPTNTSTRKVGRPFQKVISAQIEKNKRDRTLRIRMMKEKTMEQSRHDKREETMNRAMRPRKITASTQRQHRNKKSMSSAFMQLMRPLSTAFGVDPLSSPRVRRTPEELDFVPSSKPSLVLSLAHARVAQFINNERSFLFLLDTEEGGHYLLQALNKNEMRKWLENIERVSKMAAQRRLTYLGTPQPQVSDHLHQPREVTNGAQAVFGVELQELLQRETGEEEPPSGTVPLVIEQCLAEIEKRGLCEVGIYRIAGANSEINYLKDMFNKGECPLTSTTDINAICDVVKSWFRVLPGSVFPPASYYAVIDVMKAESLDDRLNGIHNVVQSLPQINYDLLKRICEHLEKVNDFEDQNNMTTDALAIVFSPNLLRAPRNDFQMILANMGYTHKLVHSLITHFNVIFDEGDPDAEHDAEDDEIDDIESPIMEEEEPDEELPAP
jgi:hypothetical protein